jgi:hypothetical protein
MLHEWVFQHKCCRLKYNATVPLQHSVTYGNTFGYPEINAVLNVMLCVLKIMCLLLKKKGCSVHVNSWWAAHGTRHNIARIRHHYPTHRTMHTAFSTRHTTQLNTTHHTSYGTQPTIPRPPARSPRAGQALLLPPWF